MKKLFATLLLMAMAMSASAYDFSAVCETGQTLYYNILNDHEVEITYPNNANGGCWLGYNTPAGNLSIPATVVNEGISYVVVSVGNRAFYQCFDLTGVEIPNTIISLQEQAFAGAGLTSLEIPNSVTSIDGWAFNACTNLLSLTIGASVSTIGSGAFASCWNLQNIHCNTPTPPSYAFFYGFGGLFNENIFRGVHSYIPVYVNCLSLNQFQSNPQWKQFTNLIGMFVGVPELNVCCNISGLGTTEIVSLPEDCDHYTATVRAIPNPGHEFSYWKKGIEMVSFSPEYTFALDQNTTLVACFDNAPIVYDSIAFPDHVIGRIFDTTSQVSHERPSNFIYDTFGQLIKYDLPGVIVSDYVFVENPTLPNGIQTTRFYYPDIEEPEWFFYTYDNNRIKHSEKFAEGMARVFAYDYYYDENWHIIKKDRINIDGRIIEQNLFEYADNYRTKIDSYYDLFHLYPNELLKMQTTSHYNERLQILSSQVDTYDEAGDITSKVLDTYSYDSNNKTESIITQTFTEEEWVNTKIVRFVYDDKNRVVEYKTGIWSPENQDWNITRKTVYDFNDEEQKLIVSFFQKSGDEWVWHHYTGQQPIFFEPGLDEWEKAIYSYHGFGINQFEITLHYMTKEKEEVFPSQSEWYYEIQNDDGSITYQHLEYVADTVFEGGNRPKIIVRSNTHYDRDTTMEVTHEYIYEEGGKVYWWNKDLEEFTILYDYAAEVGDEWEIKVGTESITIHVDEVDVFEYDGDTRKRLHISDIGDVFGGDIVVGFGHMTNFFPEKLMNQGKGYRVEGLRCYWVEDALLYHNGDGDCDAIYGELHGIEENGHSAPSTGSGTEGSGALTVYPNPANNVLFVETRRATSLPAEQEYRITNLMGQTLLQGTITAENQQINIEKLPAGMYFISVDGETVKFVVK